MKKSRRKRVSREVHFHIAAHLAGALAILGATEREFAVFRAVYSEIESRNLTRLGIGLDVMRRSITEAHKLASAARQEIREGAVSAARESAKKRTKSRILIARLVLELLGNNTPRREWVDRISPRLHKRRALSDATIQYHLRALGYPGKKQVK
jgi:hypothetical protein